MNSFLQAVTCAKKTVITHHMEVSPDEDMAKSASTRQPNPFVLWHGMGDTCCNPESMGRVTALLQDRLPGIFVHSIQIGSDLEEDHKAGFFGNLNDHIDLACQQLAAIPELANGFNAIGFSQGGLFLRAYIERCNAPPVHRLITFGSPHGGVSDIPNCMNSRDFTCALMRTLVRRGVYSDYVRHHVVQAQYFKDRVNSQGYLQKNIFLPDLNNEHSGKNISYKQHLLSLDKIVLIKFSDDTMIKPAETAWFWMYDLNGDLVPLQQQALYRDDWLGLQVMEKEGRLEFLVCPGHHKKM
ncbi:Alpha/Beta hydrolase protein [Radiomyces spectabilis]|uniref:Alpha/Beta hydrolase protein n=1 Tax=Radiomyces spectabilis TaxID=64574 RepID=UPI00222027C3|nr:Alpha/Beta hydrolase protein [Radiomyces spectabilis]KAI8379736.1 Alpha/Beta hydrolase protein [Radiomyces spectabilis]